MLLRASQIIGAMSEGKFTEMMGKSPRQVRETLFNRLAIKASGMKRVVPRPGERNEQRLKQLHQKLAVCPPSAKNEQELCTELIRNWLVHKTPMLVAALDHFEVKHENGLTGQELDFFEKLDADKVKALVATLVAKQFDAEEVGIYLRFLKVPHLSGVLPEGAYPKDAPAALTTAQDNTEP